MHLVITSNSFELTAELHALVSSLKNPNWWENLGNAPILHRM